MSASKGNGGVDESKSAEQGKDSLDDILKLSILKEDAKSELLDILESNRGRKGLIIDSNLVHMMQQVATEGSVVLKDNGVQFMKDIKLPLQDLVSDPKADFPENVIYLVRPHLPSMKIVAQHIKGLNRIGMSVLSSFRALKVFS